MPKFCAFSNRIYKNKLDENTVNEITDTLSVCNKIKAKAYKLSYNSKYKKHKYEKSIQLLLKDEFNVTSDYYVNSARKEADATLSSQSEKLKLDIDNLKNQIKVREKKIKDTEKTLENKLKVKDSLIKISKVIKENKELELEYNKFKLENPNSKKKLKLKKLPKFKTYKGAREYLVDEESLTFGVRRRKKDDLIFNIYTFEICYLNNQISKLRNRLKQLKFGLNRAKNKLNKLQNNPPKQVCFGSSKLFKKQFTTNIKHPVWKEQFDRKRNKSFTVSGRYDAVQGNFVFRYNDKKLVFKSINNKEITIDNLYFPYGQDKVEDALNMPKAQRKAAAWSIEDMGDYYIFKCIVELPKNENLNYSREDGIVSYDINYDHIAWADLNKQGSLVDRGIIKFDLDNKSSNQATNIIEEAVKQLCDIAVSKNKPLGGEDLNTEESKSKLMYGNSKKNKKLSQFAYSKIMSAIDSRAYKSNLYVYKRNPAYTSQIGKLKYMKPLGLSIHDSAAYVIGRRCLGFKEKLPKIYSKFLSSELKTKHHWSQWNYISKNLKNVNISNFYQNIETKNYKNITELKTVLSNI